MVHDDLHVLDLGRFGEVRQVGVGNHATVFAAWDRELEREVAIKVASHDTLLDIFGSDRLSALGIAEGLQQLVAELGAAAGQRYTLLREARLLAAVDHPHVVPVLEVGLLDGVPAVVMPLLAGGSLASRSLDGPWRPALALSLALGEGLAALHRAGLLHRDFKPNNVLFDGRGRPLIADLGLACRVDDDDAMADWAGTTAYMAPEVRAQRGRDHRDDLYAFCVVVFELLYGHRPFASEAARLSGRVSKIERDPPVPASVRAALVRGLAPDPAARWPDMDSLLAALREASREPRARRWPAFVVGAAAAALIGVLASSTVVHADSCSAVADELDGDWNQAIATELRGALGGDEGPAALSRWASRYVEVRRRACERARTERPPAPSSCMVELREQFVLTVETLRAPTTRAGLDVATAIAELPAPERCLERPGSDAKAVSSGLAGLRELDLAVGLAIALDDDARAETSLTQLATRARETGSSHGLARADYWRGRLARRAAHLDEAAAALRLALDGAAAIDAKSLWAEVTLELAALALALDEPRAALAYVELAHPIVSRHLPTRRADLYELEAQALLAGNDEPAAIRSRLDQAQTLRELDVERYGLSTRPLERTLALRAEIELELGDVEQAYELAERGLSLARLRKDTPLAHSQVFRRLVFVACLRRRRSGEGADSWTRLHSASTDLWAPYMLSGDEEGLAREHAWLVETYERAGFDVTGLRSVSVRPRL